MSYYMFMFYLILLGVIAFILLVFIYKNDDLEKEIKEQQGLIDESRHSLAIVEDQIKNRNDLLEYQEERYKKLKDKLTVLEAYITSNNYGSLEIKMRKLNELVNNLDKAN